MLVSGSLHFFFHSSPHLLSIIINLFYCLSFIFSYSLMRFIFFVFKPLILFKNVIHFLPIAFLSCFLSSLNMFILFP